MNIYPLLLLSGENDIPNLSIQATWQDSKAINTYWTNQIIDSQFLFSKYLYFNYQSIYCIKTKAKTIFFP